MRWGWLPLCLFLGGCAGRQSPLNPAGDQAQRLNDLWTLMLVVCAIAYLLVLLLLAWAIWRSRRALDRGPEPRPHGDRGLQLGLGVWAGFIVIGLSVLAGASFLVDRALAKGASSDLEVRVTGQQWWWRIAYRDPNTGAWVETANELHLPVNRTARVEVVAADVIHSFWVPNLSGKIDMIPGRVNAIAMTPRRIGWFRGQCAEFCGLQHAQMALDVKVETPEVFAAWLVGQQRPAPPPGPAEARGLAIITGKGCGLCHTIRGTAANGRAAPDLTHVGLRKTIAAGTLPMSRGGLIGWIAQPQALKPGAEMPATGLNPDEADAVARYLENLK